MGPTKIYSIDGEIHLFPVNLPGSPRWYICSCWAKQLLSSPDDIKTTDCEHSYYAVNSQYSKMIGIISLPALKQYYGHLNNREIAHKLSMKLAEFKETININKKLAKRDLIVLITYLLNANI